MAKEESNGMMSKSYCAECGSFNIKKVRRGFIKKRILKTENDYQCRACEATFREAQLQDNELKNMPMFIE